MNHAEQLASLKQRFTRIAGVDFFEKRPGFIFVEVYNRYASATISLYAGQIMSYIPHGQMPVLWESAYCYYQPGKALRGGIPVCWPWFGSNKDNSSLPAHGLARFRAWEFTSAANLPTGETELVLTLVDDAETMKQWPHKFRLELKVTVGAQLQVELTSHNTDNKAFTITEALHTYFAVGNIDRMEVNGFDGCDYLNALDKKTYPQSGKITITAETDRIYQHPATEAQIVDFGRNRTITNVRRGSETSVVWNPWIEKSIKMADYGDYEYPYMICVETANVGAAAVDLAPGASHTLGMTVSVKPL